MTFVYYGVVHVCCIFSCASAWIWTRFIESILIDNNDIIWIFSLSSFYKIHDITTITVSFKVVFLLFIDNKRWFNTNLVQHLIRSMYLIWILSPAHHKLQYKILLEMWSFSSYFVKLRVFHQSCPMPRKNASIAMHSGTAAQLAQPLLQLRHRTSK